MSIWQKVWETVRRANPFAALRAGDPRDSVAFTIGVIALAAKLSKADGLVTRDEVRAFREVFLIEPDQEVSVARTFNLFREDVTGFDSYARQLARMFGRGRPVLKDLLDGLFFIAAADGEFHENERTFLAEVARIFGIDDACFRQLAARHIPGEWDPWAVIGVPYDASWDVVRAKYRKEVKESHPDRLIARGMPSEMVELGHKRTAALNRAFAELREREPAV